MQLGSIHLFLVEVNTLIFSWSLITQLFVNIRSLFIITIRRKKFCFQDYVTHKSITISRKFSVNQSVMSMKFSYEIHEMFRDIRTKVIVYVSNLVVRHAFEQKIKGRTYLSSPLSNGIVQYRKPIGAGTFFFNRTISAYTFVKSPMKRSIGAILQRRWSGNSCSTSSRHVSVHRDETNGTGRIRFGRLHFPMFILCHGLYEKKNVCSAGPPVTSTRRASMSFHWLHNYILIILLGSKRKFLTSSRSLNHNSLVVIALVALPSVNILKPFSPLGLSVAVRW